MKPQTASNAVPNRIYKASEWVPAKGVNIYTPSSVPKHWNGRTWTSIGSPIKPPDWWMLPIDPNRDVGLALEYYNDTKHKWIMSEITSARDGFIHCDLRHEVLPKLKRRKIITHSNGYVFVRDAGSAPTLGEYKPSSCSFICSGDFVTIEELKQKTCATKGGLIEWHI